MASSRRAPTTTAYCFAFVGLGLVSASLGPTLPGLAENTRSTLAGISYLFTARSLGYLIGSFLAGRIYDHTRGHPIMVLVLLVMAGAMALVPAVSFLALLVVVMLVLGLAEGMLDVGGNTLLVWVHGEAVGPFMNALHFFFGVGAFLSPIIVAQALLGTGGIAWAYRALAVLLLPVALALYRLPSPSHHRPAVASDTRGDSPRLVALVALFFFLYVGAEVGFGGWVYTYAVRLNLADAASAAYLTSAFWGAFTVGRLVGIPVSARVRPRTVLAVDLVGCFGSVGVILARPDSLVHLWIGALGMGLSLASIFPTTLNFAERRMSLTGRVTSWFFVGASIGGMVLPWVIGQCLDPFGPRAMMIAIAVDLVGAAGLFTALVLHADPSPGRPKEAPSEVLSHAARRP